MATPSEKHLFKFFVHLLKSATFYCGVVRVLDIFQIHVLCYICYLYFRPTCGLEYFFNLKFIYIFRLELWEMIEGASFWEEILIRLGIIFHLRLEESKSSFHSRVMWLFSCYTNNTKLMKRNFEFSSVSPHSLICLFHSLPLSLHMPKGS